MANFPVLPKDCPSTHGGSGYAAGSYMDGNAVICGWCGTRIENPHPTGRDAEGNPRFGPATIAREGNRVGHESSNKIRTLLAILTFLCVVLSLRAGVYIVAFLAEIINRVF